MSTSIPAEAIETNRDTSAKESSRRDLRRVRILRYALGVTGCASIAFAVRWPLFYLAPVLTAFFLALPAPAQPIHEAGRLLVAVLVAFVLGLVFSHLLLPYPLVHITLLGLTFFRIYYWVNRDGTPMFAVLSLVAVMILPMMSLNQATLAHGFLLSLYFVLSAGLAVFTFLIAHAIVPEPGKPPTGSSATSRPLGYSRTAAVAALKSTLVVLPVAVLFLGMNWVSELLVVVFVAILSLSSEVTHGRAHSSRFLTANLIGGGVTVVFYFLIVAVPEYAFFVTLMFLTMLAFGSAIFSGGALANYMPPACIALLVLIGASMTEHGHFIDKPFLRVIFITLAALYVVSALVVLDQIFSGLLRARDDKDRQTRC
jgi:hypothetical protein